MRQLSCKVGYDILNVSNDEITPLTEMDYEGNQKLVIFDDYVCDIDISLLYRWYFSSSVSCNLLETSLIFFS